MADARENLARELQEELVVRGPSFRDVWVPAKYLLKSSVKDSVARFASVVEADCLLHCLDALNINGSFASANAIASENDNLLDLARTLLSRNTPICHICTKRSYSDERVKFVYTTFIQTRNFKILRSAPETASVSYEKYWWYGLAKRINGYAGLKQQNKDPIEDLWKLWVAITGDIRNPQGRQNTVGNKKIHGTRISTALNRQQYKAEILDKRFFATARNYAVRIFQMQRVVHNDETKVFALRKNADYCDMLLQRGLSYSLARVEASKTLLKAATTIEADSAVQKAANVRPDDAFKDAVRFAKQNPAKVADAWKNMKPYLQEKYSIGNEIAAVRASVAKAVRAKEYKADWCINKLCSRVYFACTRSVVPENPPDLMDIIKIEKSYVQENDDQPYVVMQARCKSLFIKHAENVWEKGNADNKWRWGRWNEKKQRYSKGGAVPLEPWMPCQWNSNDNSPDVSILDLPEKNWKKYPVAIATDFKKSWIFAVQITKNKNRWMVLYRKFSQQDVEALGLASAGTDAMDTSRDNN